MKYPFSFASLVALLFLCFSPAADAARQAPPFGESLEWNTGKEDPSLDALAGKSVLVMFYQSWCPICNDWSGELFDQFTNAYKDDSSVVLIAIKTDGGSMGSALDYLSERTDTAKWMVALDEGGVYQQQALGRDKLYEYMWVKPNGEIGEDGKSSMFTLGSNPKKFSLAQPNEGKKFREGTWNVIPDDVKLDDALKGAVDLAEKGLLLSALGEAAKLSSSVPKEDLGSFRQAIAARVEKSVETHESTVEDENSENRYLSFLSLKGIVENFGNSAPGVAAKEVVSAHDRSAWVAADEESASEYGSIMRRAQRADDERSACKNHQSSGKIGRRISQYGLRASGGFRREGQMTAVTPCSDYPARS